MTYKKQNSRPKNWRASKSNQMFSQERDFRLLEKRFWHYNRIKQAYKDAMEEQKLYLKARPMGVGGHSTGSISNPTQSMALQEPVKVVMVVTETKESYPLENPADWIQVVDETLKYFGKVDTLVKEVLQRRYFTNEGSVRTCIDLDINNVNKYYKARDVGLQYARECAIQLGLLRAF